MSKVFFGTNKINNFLQKAKPSKIIIVSSKKIFETNKWIFDTLKDGKVILVQDGEKTKNIKELEKLLLKFSKENLDRSSIIIGIGGGTIGDLVGFASSIYLRGLRFINIPTTLLGMVDSAHGGKNGINFAGYKNQIGTIKEADAIFVDTRFLKTLKREQIVDGFGEIIKYGFIKDPSIFKDLNNFEKIIKKSIRVKYFFTKDLYEKKERAILNVGHTFGHAIELKYKIGHGLAVMIGMLKEFEFTEKLGLSEKGLTEKLKNILGKLQINIDEKSYTFYVKSISHDKKVYGKEINFPVVKSPGIAYIKKINIHQIKKYAK